MAERNEKSEELASENDTTQPRNENDDTERNEKPRAKTHRFDDWAMI